MARCRSRSCLLGLLVEETSEALGVALPGEGEVGGEGEEADHGSSLESRLVVALKGRLFQLSLEEEEAEALRVGCCSSSSVGGGEAWLAMLG